MLHCDDGGLHRGVVWRGDGLDEKKKKYILIGLPGLGIGKMLSSPLGSLLLFNNEVGYRFKKSHKFSVK